MSEHLISEELKEKLKKVNDNFIEKYGTYLPKDDYAKETNMNKYLFRGIRKDNGKWIEGGYCYCNNKSYIVIATQYIPDTRDWDTADYYEKNPVYKPIFIEVYTKTVGQWTEMVDKKGVNIFEGDIVQYINDDDFDCQSVVKLGAYKQDGSGGEYSGHTCIGFYVKVDNFTCPDWCEDDPEYFPRHMWHQNIFEVATRCEIIGNIYDNSELLK